MNPSLPVWADVETALEPMQLGLSPAELHGGLSGWLCGGGDPHGNWLGRILADDAVSETQSPPLLALRDATAAAIGDPDFGFALLLPAAGTTLEARGNALFEWCRAFLGGFGLAAGAAPMLSDEAREALDDLARLAAAEAESGGDEEDEAAFLELEEFVRVAALLLHGDCVLGARHRQRLH